MAITISSNYYAVTQARATAAGNQFNFDFDTIKQTTNAVCEVVISENMLVSPMVFNLPKIEVLKGNQSFSLIIRDGNRFIGPGNEVEIIPFTDPTGVYSDAIGPAAPGASITFVSGEGVELFWCLSPTDAAPNSGYWGCTTQRNP